ncbi:unnamed protein product [Mesocestoides corti]|nr:unnamed protein product [Mesocestoides corti]
MLLRTSQAEIAKLKRELQSRGKTYVHTTSRRPRKSTLDPHRTIDQMDLIECLHTPVNYESAANIKSLSVSRRSEVRQPSHLCQQKRQHSSTSSSGSSSSASSSSSSSSPSSSSASDIQKVYPHQKSSLTTFSSQKTSAVGDNASVRPRTGKTRVHSTTASFQKRRPSMGNGSASFQSSKGNKPLGRSSKLFGRSPKPTVTMTVKSVPSATYAVSNAEESNQNHKQMNAVPVSSAERSTADAATGISDGPEAHLQRLVRASVRSARDHHSASIVFAPPLKGKRLTDDEKSFVDAYLRAEEHRCIAVAKRARSQSPLRSQPFSPTIFTRRQMIKRSSLCSPPSFAATSTANTVVGALNVSMRCHVAPQTPPDEEEEEENIQSGGDAPSAYPCRGAPHTPEDEYVEEVGEEFANEVDLRTTGALHEDEVNNCHSILESPQIEIEDEISDAASQ